MTTTPATPPEGEPDALSNFICEFTDTQNDWSPESLAIAILAAGYVRPAPTQGDRDIARQIVSDYWCDDVRGDMSIDERDEKLEARIATALAAQRATSEARLLEMTAAYEKLNRECNEWHARAIAVEARVRELEIANYAASDRERDASVRADAAEAALATAREDALRRAEEIATHWADHEPNAQREAIARGIAAAIAAERGGKG
jgi:hypothetical protein